MVTVLVFLASPGWQAIPYGRELYQLHQPPPSRERRSKHGSFKYHRQGVSLCRGLMWIVIFAFAARVVVRWYGGASDFWENGYTFFFALAQNIAAGNGVSLDGGHLTAFRVPLYPMFLAAVTLGHRVFLPVVLAQSLIGAGTVLCAALIARALFGNIAAIIAGAL